MNAALLLLLTVGNPLTYVVPSGNPSSATASGVAHEEEAESGVTAELLEGMMERLAEDAFNEGRDKLERGELLAALESFEQAHDFSPDDPDIIFHLGIVSYRLGNLERAEHYLRLSYKLDPERERLVVRLADVVLQREPGPAELEELERLLAEARSREGSSMAIVLRQARVAARRQETATAEGLYREALAEKDVSDSVRLEVGDFYRNAGREEEALAWYHEVDPDSEAWDDARERIWQIEVDRQARRYGWTRPSTEVSDRARAMVTRARGLIARERLREAEAALRDALGGAPQFTEARVLLGDVLRSRGQQARAELEYLRCLAFDQGSAQGHARLGELYLAGGGPERAAEALVLLNRALQLRPDWSALHFQLARAYRLSGDLPRAQQALRAYLAGRPTDEGRERAEELQRAIDRLLAGEALPEPPSEAEPSKRELVSRLNRVRAHLSRGETDAAMAELRRIVAEERGPEVRNLEGRLLHAVGKLDEAVDAFRASLELDPDQADVHQQLGIVLLSLDRADRAREHLLRAEELGDLDASYHLGRLAVRDAGRKTFGSITDAGSLLEGRDRLVRFLEQSPPDSAFVKDAMALRRTVDRRLAGSAGLLFAVLFVPLGGGLFYRRQRYGGADLKTLITEHPESGPDVQRVLSAIRHEVLKHNTMALTGLVEALEQGEDIGDKAQHLRRSLFGGEEDEPAVAPRFRAYVGELRKIGRAHGLSLNLRRKDRALAPIHDGFAILRRLGRRLGRLGDPAPRVRRKVLGQLREATELLNDRAYNAVQDLLTELRVLIVDRDVLIGVFDRTRSEPAFANVRIEPLDLSLDVDMPCSVRIPRGAFEDVLSNLFRNALQASVRNQVVPIQVGLAVRGEINAITGHERVAFAVRDKSPEALQVEQLLGQKIEGGLGLTAELASKYDGSLDVENDHEGWAKAVVIKLPREEVE